MRDRTRARKEGHQRAGLSRREERSSGGETCATDLDELKKHHRFLREDDDDDDDKKEEETGTRRGRGEEEEAMSLLLNEGERVARKYEGKLFKEYAIPDLSRWDTQGVGLRWRTEKEVARGKGVDICGEKRCSERKNLGTFELNFRYKEGGRGEVKNALVKVVVCPVCEEKMNRSRRRKKK